MLINGKAVIDKRLDDYVKLLKSDKVFSFARFGDAEWAAILDYFGTKSGYAFFPSGASAGGCIFVPEMCEELRHIVLNPGDYMYGMLCVAMNFLGDRINAFIAKNNINISWYKGNIFAGASNTGALFPLIQQLRSMKVVVIGDEKLKKLNEKVFDYDHFIEIPPKNCYLKKNEIKQEILEYYHKKGPAVFSFSAAAATNILIHELFPVMGGDSWLIDFGALWDVYIGVRSRGYSKNMTDAIISKNLGVLK